MSLSHPGLRLVRCYSPVPRHCDGCRRAHIGLGDRYWWHHDSGQLVHVDCMTDELHAHLHALSNAWLTDPPPARPILQDDPLLPAERPEPESDLAWEEDWERFKNDED